MKKTFLGFIVLGAIALTSCKKDYTCECTTTDGSTTITASTTIKETKKKATDACEAGSSSVGGFTTTCKIK